MLKEDLDFEKISLDDRKIYFAEYFHEAERDYFVAYIQKQKNIGSVELRFIIHNSILEQRNNLVEVFINMSKSVKFIDPK